MGLTRILAAACLAGMAALAMPAEAAIKGLADKGKVLAEENCGRCHAVGPEGASPHEEAPPFRTFVEKWPLEHLEEALAEGIVTGHPDMPMFVFQPPEIDALIEYLHTLAPENSQPASD
jgi:cytochrome c